MNNKSYVIEGDYTVINNGVDFQVNIKNPANELNIRGFSRAFLNNKDFNLSEEHGIYILEGESSLYVGQTKNIKERIKTHQGNNKAEFKRCFILSRTVTDWRPYLDFMESYTIEQMKNRGYFLENTKCPKSELDPLTQYKKSMAIDWVNNFLDFLPMLGLSIQSNTINSEIKVNQSCKPEPKTDLSKINNTYIIKINDHIIEDKKVSFILKKLMIYIGFEKLLTYRKMSKNFYISKESKSTRHEQKYIENDQTFYFKANYSILDYKKLILKLGQEYNIQIEFINF